MFFTIDSDASKPAATFDPRSHDLVYRYGSSPGTIEELSLPKQDTHYSPIQLLNATNGTSAEENASSRASDLGSRAKALLSPTSDGGPPLARPIVLVSLEDTQFRKIIDESLAATSERDAKKCKECAQEAVDYASCAP